MFEAGSQNFASAPSVPRGFKLKNFRPSFGGDPRGTLGGGWSQSNVPPPLQTPPSPPFLIHPWEWGGKMDVKRASLTLPTACCPAKPRDWGAGQPSVGPLIPATPQAPLADLSCLPTDAADCVVSEWTAWGPCDATCGAGSRTRSRTLQVPIGGAQCPEAPLSEAEACNTVPCAGALHPLPTPRPAPPRNVASGGRVRQGQTTGVCAWSAVLCRRCSGTKGWCPGSPQKYTPPHHLYPPNTIPPLAEWAFCQNLCPLL